MAKKAGVVKIVLLLFLLSILFLAGCAFSVEERIHANSRVAELTAEGWTFETYPYNGTELDALAERFPVIYDDLETDSIMVIEMTKGSGGKLLIYDPIIDDVVREFDVTGLQLN